MKGFLKPKLILPLVTVVLLAAAIAVPLLSDSISRLPTALSILSRQRTAHAASGDWPTFLFNMARSGFNGSETVINRNTAPHLKVRWTRMVGSNGSHIISAEPVEANGMIYWGDWGGVEHASRLSDGTDVWTAQLGTSTCSGGTTRRGVTSTATIATELIGGVSTPVDYVGGGANATFYALNANTGAVIWQTVLSSQPGAYIWSSPAVFNHRVYIGLASVSDCPLVQGQLLQLNALTDAIQHTLDTVPTGCIGGSVWSSPTIDKTSNIIYISTGNEGTCSTTETMADALVALSGEPAVIDFNIVVVVPGLALTVPELDKAHALFQQAPGDEQLPGVDARTTTLFRCRSPRPSDRETCCRRSTRRWRAPCRDRCRRRE